MDNSIIKRSIIKAISAIFKIAKIDPFPIAYYFHGIGKYDDTLSGESYFINNLLPKLIDDDVNVTMFDVGANIGNYSKILRSVYSKANIHAFEPNPHTYIKLKENLSGSTIHTVNYGLGEIEELSYIYTYSNNHESQHASIFKEVITDLHFAKDLMKIPIEIKTIDGYCLEKNINKIDFLKIDTEGYELNVLKGAKRMLLENRIGIIQFEFNEMNIISRVFLKDFYDLLGETYDFYRLDSKKLIPLNEYKPSNEIFLFQNIICLKK